LLTCLICRINACSSASVSCRLEGGVVEALTYYSFPASHWRRIRRSNPLQRIMRENRRRTRLVAAVSDVKSAFMVAAAWLGHIAGTRWRTKHTPRWICRVPRLARVPRGISSARTTAKQTCKRSCDRSPLQFLPLVVGGDYPACDEKPDALVTMAPGS
jgi:hypothetical protein